MFDVRSPLGGERTEHACFGHRTHGADSIEQSRGFGKLAIFAFSTKVNVYRVFDGEQKERIKAG
jgi:hypothetical protein